MNKELVKPQYIEVMKIVTDKVTKHNTHSEPHTLNIQEIKSARKWHKHAVKDQAIRGGMTILVLKKEEMLFNDEQSTQRHLLIEEDYETFIQRCNERVPISRPMQQ